MLYLNYSICKKSGRACYTYLKNMYNNSDKDFTNGTIYYDKVQNTHVIKDVPLANDKKVDIVLFSKANTKDLEKAINLLEESNSYNIHTLFHFFDLIYDAQYLIS